jgi:hypothetical protein
MPKKAPKTSHMVKLRDRLVTHIGGLEGRKKKEAEEWKEKVKGMLSSQQVVILDSALNLLTNAEKSRAILVAVKVTTWYDERRAATHLFDMGKTEFTGQRESMLKRQSTSV